MKIVFIYNKSKLSGMLTKFFTGTYCYHVAFVDEEHNEMYDMNLLRRIRNWPYYHGSEFVLIDAPVNVSREYLMKQLKFDENSYGVIDYILFGLRPIYHFFGKSTRNANGVLCSEMVYNDLFTNGWNHYFSEVPSPGDLEESLLGIRNYLYQ